MLSFCTFFLEIVNNLISIDLEEMRGENYWYIREKCRLKFILIKLLCTYENTRKILFEKWSNFGS